MVGVRGARNKDILQVRGYVRRIKGIVQTRFLLFIETSFTESSIILLYNKQFCSSKYNVIWKHTTLSIKHHSVNCSVRVCVLLLILMNLHMMSSTMTDDIPFEKLLGWQVLLKNTCSTTHPSSDLSMSHVSAVWGPKTTLNKCLKPLSNLSSKELRYVVSF